MPRRPTPSNPWWALLAVALGQFMVVLDVTILNIALPSLAADLGAEMAELEWALISYSLTMIGLVPLFGRISDVVGRKRLYLLGLLVFGAASALAAAASGIVPLILARVLQAVGGALISSNTLAILTDLFPAGRRGIAMGVQSIVISGGAAVGPVVGGLLVSAFGWEAVFLVNVPVGAATALLAVATLPASARSATREPLDVVGAALLLGGLVGGLLGITRAPLWGWTAPSTWAALALGAVLLVAFWGWQLRARFPLVKPALLHIRPFVAGQTAGLFATLALVAVVFLQSFYWQAPRALPASTAGLLMLPVPLGLMLMAPLAGRLSDRIGARGLTTVGLLVAAAAGLLLSRIGVDTALWDVEWRLLLVGLGLGLFLAPNNNAVMSAAPVGDRGVAAGLLALFRFSGQALGIAFAGTIFLAAAGGEHGHELLSAEGFRDGAEARVTDFMAGYRAVCLAIVPVALLGAALSFSRGGRPASEPG